MFPLTNQFHTSASFSASASLLCSFITFHMQVMCNTLAQNLVTIYRHSSFQKWKISGSKYLGQPQSLLLSLPPPTAPPPPGMMKCLHTPFTVHKQELLNLLSSDKSWKSNQCSGSCDVVCNMQTQSPALLQVWLLTPAVTEGTGSEVFFQRPYIYLDIFSFQGTLPFTEQVSWTPYCDIFCYCLYVNQTKVFTLWLLLSTSNTRPQQDVQLGFLWPAAGMHLLSMY